MRQEPSTHLLGLAWMEATGGLGVEDSLGTAGNVFNHVIGWFTFTKKIALASLYNVNLDKGTNGCK